MRFVIPSLCTAVALAACSLPENKKLAEAPCEKVAISDTRNMFVCEGPSARLDAFDVAAGKAAHPLVRKPESAIDPKDVAQKFDIPPSEISGIVTATTRGQKPATRVNFVELNGTKFAVYQRDGATIYIERKK